MINKLILKIADIRNDRLRAKGIITDENYSIKDYVFRDKCYDFFVLVLFTLIGFIIGCPLETIVVSMTFSFLRSFCGGYHSLEGDYHYEWCIIISLITLIPSALLAHYITFSAIFWVVVIPCVVLIYCKTPTLNQGEELEKSIDEYRGDYIFWTIVSLLIAVLSPANIQNSILLANICITPFMSKRVGKILNKMGRKIFRE